MIGIIGRKLRGGRTSHKEKCSDKIVYPWNGVSRVRSGICQVSTCDKGILSHDAPLSQKQHEAPNKVTQIEPVVEPLDSSVYKSEYTL